LKQGTDGRVYFHRVIIVVPPMWDTRACGRALPVNSFTSRSSTNHATIRIGTEHPVFGHLPWTQQSRGCGLQGDFISVGYHSILQFNETENGINGHVTNSQQPVSNENGVGGLRKDNANGLDYAAVPTGKFPIFTSRVRLIRVMVTVIRGPLRSSHQGSFTCW